MHVLQWGVLNALHDTSITLTSNKTWQGGKFSESHMLWKYYCSWVIVASQWLQQFTQKKI